MWKLYWNTQTSKYLSLITIHRYISLQSYAYLIRSGITPNVTQPDFTKFTHKRSVNCDKTTQYMDEPPPNHNKMWFKALLVAFYRVKNAGREHEERAGTVKK